MRRYELRKRRERVIRWFVWRLPREVVMWSYVRVAAHATTGKYGDTVVPELGMMDALKRWDEDTMVARGEHGTSPLTLRQFVILVTLGAISRVVVRWVMTVVRALREAPTFKYDVDD